MKIGSVVVFLLVFGGCGTAAKYEAPKPIVKSENTPARKWKLSGDPSVVYARKDVRGFQIETVRLLATDESKLSEDESMNWYLARVKGGDDELNGHVFLTKRKIYSKRHSYIANIKGEPRLILFYPDTNKETWEFFVKGNTWKLAPDPKAAEIGEELLVRYYEALDSGIQEKLAPSTREGRKESQDRILDTTRAELKAACNLESLTIDWSTVKEGLMDEEHIAKTCSQNVQTIINLCESYSNAVTKVETLSKVQCDFSRYSSTEIGQVAIEGDELRYFLSPMYQKSLKNYRTDLGTHFGEMDQVLVGANSKLINRYSEGNKVQVYIELENRYYPISGRIMQGLFTSLDWGIRKASLYHEGKNWSLQCDVENEPLTRLVGEKRAEVLSNAVFEKEGLWKREPYFLARDTRGVYYYVDRYSRDYGGSHYRVFVGKRGMLKLTKLKGLVEDSEGTVFSTDKGDLRLIVSPKNSALWIRGNSRSELTAVDTYRNRKLIFDELGVYFGENLGHICDE